MKGSNSLYLNVATMQEIVEKYLNEHWSDSGKKIIVDNFKVANIGQQGTFEVSFKIEEAVGHDRIEK